jgi:hypothetical protein
MTYYDATKHGPKSESICLSVTELGCGLGNRMKHLKQWQVVQERKLLILRRLARKSEMTHILRRRI